MKPIDDSLRAESSLKSEMRETERKKIKENSANQRRRNVCFLLVCFFFAISVSFFCLFHFLFFVCLEKSRRDGAGVVVVGGGGVGVVGGGGVGGAGGVGRGVAVGLGGVAVAVARRRRRRRPVDVGLRREERRRRRQRLHQRLQAAAQRQRTAVRGVEDERVAERQRRQRRLRRAVAARRRRRRPDGHHAVAQLHLHTKPNGILSARR